ncbi:MAG: hypothetical protein SFV22_02505 [Saprospiraceae bacterium]|nr:hypothetical protein [Saprospiraceae bacterium]
MVKDCKWGCADKSTVTDVLHLAVGSNPELAGLGASRFAVADADVQAPTSGPVVGSNNGIKR